MDSIVQRLQVMHTHLNEGFFAAVSCEGVASSLAPSFFTGPFRQFFPDVDPAKVKVFFLGDSPVKNRQIMEFETVLSLEEFFTQKDMDCLVRIVYQPLECDNTWYDADLLKAYHHYRSYLGESTGSNLFFLPVSIENSISMPEVFGDVYKWEDKTEELIKKD